MNIAAFDVGLSGAACLLQVDAGYRSVASIIDMPTLPDGTNRQVDVPAICRWIDKWHPEYAIIENVQPMPSIPGTNGIRRGMGAASSFRFGFAVGQIRAVAACYGLKIRLVHPQSWKRHHGLKGSDKEHSRMKALELMPLTEPYLRRVKDHNRAESCLLAIYGADSMGML